MGFSRVDRCCHTVGVTSARNLVFLHVCAAVACFQDQSYVYSLLGYERPLRSSSADLLSVL